MLENYIKIIYVFNKTKVQQYCYANWNDLISFKINNGKTKTTLTHINIELVVSKPTTILVWI